MKEQLKVYSAALLGFGAPATNWFVEVAEPLLKLLLLVGQIGVATATIFYIVAKWRKVQSERADQQKRNDRLDRIDRLENED
jgi:hypothetical protein